jgi:hypothetical protein
MAQGNPENGDPTHSFDFSETSLPDLYDEARVLFDAFQHALLVTPSCEQVIADIVERGRTIGFTQRELRTFHFLAMPAMANN